MAIGGKYVGFWGEDATVDTATDICTSFPRRRESILSIFSHLSMGPRLRGDDGYNGDDVDRYVALFCCILPQNFPIFAPDCHFSIELPAEMPYSPLKLPNGKIIE